MGLDGNYYSIEAISDALSAAGSIAASSHDEAEIVRGHLIPLSEILQMNCAVLYAGAESPLAEMSPVRVRSVGRRDLQAPTSVPESLEAYVRAAQHSAVTSY